ncbi:MAG: transcriptional regulator NrdR [Candidatus Komeilibacteria bacterium]|nr:transcriptional regulator NrdR [Candidatus Komeilibacteria bacterium]
MRCPVCLAPDSKVNDSRLVEDGFAIRRRRECQRCNYRFSTYENTEILNLAVIKRDGRKEAYQREKLESGLKKSLEKRPYTLDQFKKLINQIERDLQKKQRDEITSQEIGEVIMKRLKNFDKVAFIRFASVYRSFDDVQTFQRELQQLLGKRSAKTKLKK